MAAPQQRRNKSYTAPRRGGVILLDRDGVLNVNRADYVQTPAQLRLAPHSAAAVKLLCQAGLHPLVITNQACVGKGLVTKAMLNAIHAALAQRIARAGGCIHGFYVCPHAPQAQCNCRKPAPGLILQAQREWGFRPEQTWFVGDSTRDVDAALAAGCKAALVRTCGAVNAHAPAERPATSNASPYFRNLWDFSQWLLPQAPRHSPTSWRHKP